MTSAGAEIRGIALLAVPTADEAKAHFAEDPFVKAGVMTVEVRQKAGRLRLEAYPWMTFKGILK